ncbi:maleylpyruvate isomerase N-terminal domain-containing protein [Hymenobacter sp. GOD-10R]|uniref:maleylpyruvate isomerase N-terminal domain-containing protein n=1 Tax=Hymenobacter sp. GOD-10R TaxID=3093922 RepID=UPI002D77821E|nr:maleylpyruvate isomerase N-terminal domain-containing protein [Hymenobacter sp. GOD-10R]WRQ27409.1 maleylpyruvate isomerase N-terminal domain-containing protein [Hymenobacter sp. GOD-10R]
MPEPPINVVPLLPQLDEKLMALLKSLTPEDWQRQTIAKLWKVKDVVAHLLDGNLRVLSMLRDHYTGEAPPPIHSYQDLVDFLNGLNADWVKAMKRVSPGLLILLHEATGQPFCDYYASLDPFALSPFSVAWTGESESQNWMHIAREYTEKWLHQQQIRDAVQQPGLMTREFFYPFINIFMRGLPHTYRAVDAETATIVQLTIPTEIGGSWYLQKAESGWAFTEASPNVATEVVVPPDVAWRLFSKSLRPDHVREQVEIRGNQQLGEVALQMVSVMA